MILKSSFSQSTPNALSSAISYSPSFPSEYHFFTPLSKFRTLNHSVKCSSVSQVYKSYGAPTANNQMWTRIYGRLAFNNPQLEVASVLNQIEKEGKQFTKWELCVVVKELRKFKRFKLTLEVYEWTNNRAGRFERSSNDYVNRSPYTY